MNRPRRTLTEVDIAPLAKPASGTNLFGPFTSPVYLAGPDNQARVPRAASHN